MPTQLPYLPSYKNVDKFFEALAAAKTPDAVTQRFLQETLGLKSTGDRPLIPLLRQLGFIDSAGKPTPSYSALKNPSRVRAAMAEAIRGAYRPLFDANESADKLSNDELRGLVAQVAGTDKDMTTKILGTFNALRRRADFAAAPPQAPAEELREPEVDQPLRSHIEPEPPGARGFMPASGFHFNIQVHLPANATEEVYVSIFSAIRKVFS